MPNAYNSLFNPSSCATRCRTIPALCLLSPLALCALRPTIAQRQAPNHRATPSAQPSRNAKRPTIAQRQTPNHRYPIPVHQPLVSWMGWGHGFPFHFSERMANKHRPFLKNETEKLCEDLGDFSGPSGNETLWKKIPRIGTNRLMITFMHITASIVMNGISCLSTTNTVTRGALFTERCLLHAFLQKSGRLFFVQLYYGVLNEQGEMSMNPLPWLADPAFYAETSPDQERFLIAQVKYQQELECLHQDLDAVLKLLLRVGMAELHATNPESLPLPSQLSAIEQDRRYYLACLQGRLFYRSDQYQYDEQSDQTLYKPVQYTRAMIRDHIVYVVQLPDDPRFAASIPLAFRVGLVVGWLSGLSTSQKDDAQAGMVLLAALVAPLLLCNVPTRADAPKQKHRSLSAPLRKGSRSKQSRKR